MVSAPDSLVWLVVRNNNAFLKKKNGQTARTGAIHFSTEAGNLKSLSTFKYSGIAQSKAVDVASTPASGANGPTATLSKKTVQAGSKPSKGVAKTPINKHFRKVEKSILSQTSDNFYRPDLKGAALAKWSAVYRSNRVAKGVKKVVPVKKGRN